MSDPFASMAATIHRANGFGRPALYSSLSEGTESTVSVIVSHDLTQWGDSIRIQNGMAIIAVQCAEVPDRPRRGDTFVLESGQTYAVESVLPSSDDLEHRCLVLESDE
jgi:hypothetical protein